MYLHNYFLQLLVTGKAVAGYCSAEADVADKAGDIGAPEKVLGRCQNYLVLSGC
jgi:uncharacterized membrane protein YiaA